MPLAHAVKHKLQIEFPLEEYDLLDALEHEVLWSGRYPSARNVDVPSRLKKKKGMRKWNFNFKKFIFDYPNDHCATIKLYDRLETILQNQARNGPQPS